MSAGLFIIFFYQHSDFLNTFQCILSDFYVFLYFSEGSVKTVTTLKLGQNATVSLVGTAKFEDNFKKASTYCAYWLKYMPSGFA